MNYSMSNIHNDFSEKERESRKVQDMFGSIAKRYDLINGVLSGGIHILWRNTLFREIKRRLARDCRESVIDLCTGTGALISGLRAIFARVYGVDFCLPMLQQFRGGKNIATDAAILLQGDALNMPIESGSCSAVTVAYGVRNFEKLEVGLREIHRVLRPGGMVFILEFGQPSNRMLNYVYRWYSFNLMPRIGALISGNRDAYTYLPSTVSNFPFGGIFTTILEDNGFIDVGFRSLTFGIAYIYWGKRP